MRYIILAALAVVSIIHLYDSWADNPKKRRVTKPYLLILILLYYVFSRSGLPISWVLVAALLTSWLGDVLLMPQGNKWFVAGGISFLISHILFIVVYAMNVIKLSFNGVIWWIVAIAAVIYLGIAFVVTRAIKDTTPKAMVAPMYLYLIFNSAMNVFSLMQLMTYRSPGAVVAYIGAILFFASDCTLYLVKFHKNKDLIYKRHFTVMLTYILGEFLITQGLLMIG